MNQPNTSIFPLGIGVSVDVSLFQLHRLYSALPCYRALRPYMYFYVHVHVHRCVRYEVYFAMWTYLLSSVLSEPLCSEGSPAHLARCGKYRGISNYSVVSLLHWGEPPGNYNPREPETRDRIFIFKWSSARRLRPRTSRQY